MTPGMRRQDRWRQAYPKKKALKLAKISVKQMSLESYFAKKKGIMMRRWKKRKLDNCTQVS